MTCMCRAGGLGMGLSAQAIRYGGTFHPHDPSDLCRCLAVSPNPPAHMLGRSPEWRVLVLHWQELADLLAQEHPTGSAPKTYARMKELLASARQGKEPPPVTQASLFDDDPPPREDPRAYAKRDDPTTSWEAAASISPDQLRDRHKAVLRVLKTFGPQHNDALADKYQAIAAQWDLPSQTDQSVRSRRSELTKMGLVVDTGETVVLGSGRRAVIWRAVQN